MLTRNAKVVGWPVDAEQLAKDSALRARSAIADIQVYPKYKSILFYVILHFVAVRAERLAKYQRLAGTPADCSEHSCLKGVPEA